MVQLHRRTGGVSGIYRCVIPDQSGVSQTLNVGLYAIPIPTSGKLTKTYALYMSDGKHYPCCVSMLYLVFSIDKDFLLASYDNYTFLKESVLGIYVFQLYCSTVHKYSILHSKYP